MNEPIDHISIDAENPKSHYKNSKLETAQYVIKGRDCSNNILFFLDAYLNKRIEGLLDKLREQELQNNVHKTIDTKQIYTLLGCCRIVVNRGQRADPSGFLPRSNVRPNKQLEMKISKFVKKCVLNTQTKNLGRPND